MRRIIAWTITGLTLTILPAGAGKLHAADGSVPIFAPTTITVPGHYVVTRDFTTTGPGILIQANDVTVDLNGHTITGPAGACGLADLIRIDTAFSTRGVLIRNGRLLSGCHGISATSTNPLRVRIEEVEVDDSSFEEVYIAGNAETVEIVKCHIHDGRSDGIFVSGSDFKGRFVDNTIEHVVGDGMLLNGVYVGEILRNVVADFGSDPGFHAGIHLLDTFSGGLGGGILVEGNTVSSLPSGVNDDGIRVRVSHTYVVNNITRNNGRNGITSNAIGVRIVGNLSSKNGSSGILLDTLASRNLLDGNQVESNGACHIYFSTDGSHIYRNNIARTSGPVTGICNGWPSNTDAGGNIQ